MKDFKLTDKMLSLGGVFYPTGYAFIMFPNSKDARQVARELKKTGSDDILLLTPATILEEIGKAAGDSDLLLPSLGTERNTAQKYLELAREGHHALMIPVDSEEATERVMSVVRKFPFSYAQRYHMLVIEDLE
ncbi:MAG: hypothetical protein A3E79_17430 [Burkholderiales bacterium RIFCSPHIGHO2_12_FULL_61_11]|nr:MAG: hypothetical protein A3E79_17430 [Burkholderiales bacterium RIFCSPHIGHO2_12_FULL_61_11]